MKTKLKGGSYVEQGMSGVSGSRGRSKYGQQGMSGYGQTASQLGSTTRPGGNVNKTGTITQTINTTNTGKVSNSNANNNANNANNTDDNMLESNISAYKIIIIVVLLILILCIIGYFVSFSYKEGKALYELDISKSYMFIDSKLNTLENREKTLGDFYIACSYRPYLVKHQILGYNSLKILKNILMGGVRCVYLDVFNSTLNENAYPVVTTGLKEGEWKLGLNSLNFEDVCQTIAVTVFSSGYVNNYRDPFVLCLNLNTNGNVKCLNKIKKILYSSFKSNLLNNNYTFSSINMAKVPIKELLEKVIIFTSGGYENSQLEELVNYSWDKQELNQISYGALDPLVPDSDAIKYNSDSLKSFNKNNITMVVPKEFSLKTSNYNPQYAWDSGCQLVFINYNNSDANYDSYITKFRNDSFLPKPAQLLS